MSEGELGRERHRRRPALGRKPAGKAAAAGDSSNDDPEFVDAKNEDDIYMVPLGMGKGNYNYGRATHDCF